MNRRLVLTAAAAAALALTAACGHEAAPKTEATPVRVVEAAPLASRGGLRYSATIQPREEVQLAFKSGGYVDEIRRVAGADGATRPIQGGDRVARGTVLARVRQQDYAQKVSEARASLADADAAAERYASDFQRAERLFASNSMTRPEWEATRAASKSSRAHVEAARAQLETAETALGDASLKSPLDGVVISRHVEQGSFVAAGTPGFVVADLSSVKAVFGVPDRVVSTLRLGEPMTVTTEAAAGPFRGVLTALSPSADRKSRVFDVEVTIPNADGRLRSGLIAAIEILPEGASAASSPLPAVPLSAVVSSPARANSYAVFVVSDAGAGSKANARDVKLGRISGNSVTIAEGLRAGERVVVSGASLLTDDAAVRIVP
jgi:RND family efflux transporter MFP subunit